MKNLAFCLLLLPFNTAFAQDMNTVELRLRDPFHRIDFWDTYSGDDSTINRYDSFSILIAVPLAYYGMSQWLKPYLYQAPLSWWIFASAGAGIIVNTMLTVSYQSLRAALTNPVRSLRSK